MSCCEKKRPAASSAAEMSAKSSVGILEDKVANIIVEADGNISQIDVDADGDEIKVTGKQISRALH